MQKLYVWAVFFAMIRGIMVYYDESKRKGSDAEGGICFSCAIRERAACAAGGKARQRGLVI